ncbi:MAG: Uracil-DNA glycosylase [Bacteroidia bacterium]|nr:Uracil-DNA glycosylase [Bacteroidia bacterium]
MSNVNPSIDLSWKEQLTDEFNADYFTKLKEFLITEKQTQRVFPPGNKIFSAFNHTPFDKVKVVILGQDPYHGEGQAHGLCFSVPDGVAKPPSLVNIFKEINDDLGLPFPSTGNLEKWADQGVLLLNATLTVRANIAGSHQKRGWENFTDAAIKKLSDKRENLVFILWGRFAQNKEVLIDASKHCILKSAHPSPLSAYNGFFGCKHFSKTNEYLRSKGIGEIDWSV